MKDARCFWAGNLLVGQVRGWDTPGKARWCIHAIKALVITDCAKARAQLGLLEASFKDGWELLAHWDSHSVSWPCDHIHLLISASLAIDELRFISVSVNNTFYRLQQLWIDQRSTRMKLLLFWRDCIRAGVSDGSFKWSLTIARRLRGQIILFGHVIQRLSHVLIWLVYF